MDLSPFTNIGPICEDHFIGAYGSYRVYLDSDRYFNVTNLFSIYFFEANLDSWHAINFARICKAAMVRIGGVRNKIYSEIESMRGIYYHHSLFPHVINFFRPELSSICFQIDKTEKEIRELYLHVSTHKHHQSEIDDSVDHFPHNREGKFFWEKVNKTVADFNNLSVTVGLMNYVTKNPLIQGMLKERKEIDFEIEDTYRIIERALNYQKTLVDRV